MTRPDDWPEQLAAFVEARRNTPFSWGTQDCIAFAADAVVMLIGVDILAEYRGAYATEEEAETILAAEGGLDGLLTRLGLLFSLAECAPARAKRGDLVLVHVGNQAMGGIVIGNSVAVTGADGVQFVPTRCIQRAWVV
jgi:cell wall-associated NlpC family hydrolase